MKRAEINVRRIFLSSFMLIVIWLPGCSLLNNLVLKSSPVVEKPASNLNTNHHSIEIRKGAQDVFNFLLNGSPSLWLPKEIKMTRPNNLYVGAKTHFQLNIGKLIEWDTKVLAVKENKQIESLFLEGMFEGGREVWTIKVVEAGVELSHTLLYKEIRPWTYKVIWSIYGEEKHNELTIIALTNIKNILENNNCSSPNQMAGNDTEKFSSQKVPLSHRRSEPARTKRISETKSLATFSVQDN